MMYAAQKIYQKLLALLNTASKQSYVDKKHIRIDR